MSQHKLGLSLLTSKTALTSSGRQTDVVQTILGKHNYGFLGSSNSNQGILHSIHNDTQVESEDQAHYFASATTSSVAGRNRAAASEESHRTSGSSNSRFLLHILSGSQEGWGAKTSSQFEGVESICSGLSRKEIGWHL
jgi:hypothetical protein